MHIHFYTHLIDQSAISKALDEMMFSEEERTELDTLVQERMHQSVMHAILMQLSEEDKKIFLRQVAMNDHAHIWRFLHKKTNNIENEILKVAKALHNEMHEDIKKAKNG